MARLPVPGSDDGAWGDILNDFLAVEHNGDGTLKAGGSLSSKVPTSRTVSAGTGLTGGGDLSADRSLAVSYGTSASTAAEGNDSRITGAQQRSVLTTKGDIYVATASGTTTRLGVGSDNTVLTADSSQTAGVRWAAASGGSSVDFSAAALGLTVQTFPPALTADRFAISSGLLVACLVYLPGTAISSLGIGLRTSASSSSGINVMALYRRVSATSATLVDQTADMTTAFTTGGPGWISGTLTGGSQSPAAGQYYVVALTHFGTPPTVVAGPDIGNSYGPSGLVAINSRLLSVYTTGQTTLPASFNPTSYSVNNVVYYMTVG